MAGIAVHRGRWRSLEAAQTARERVRGRRGGAPGSGRCTGRMASRAAGGAHATAVAPPPSRGVCGLQTHGGGARALCAAGGDGSGEGGATGAAGSASRLIAATLRLRGAPNTLLRLEHRAAAGTLTQVASYEHPHEVWDVACAPGSGGDVIATAYNDARASSGGGGQRRRGALWRMGDSALEELCALESDAPVRRVAFDRSGATVAAVSDAAVATYDVATCKASGSGTRGGEPLAEVGAAAWDPHSDSNVGATAGTSVWVWDTRANKRREALSRAHAMRCRALSFDPARQHRIATGGDDCRVRLWDLRHAAKPVEDFGGGGEGGHSHWVWNVAFNPRHESLLASSGSDGGVCLWYAPASGATPALPDDALPMSPMSPGAPGETPGLACSYDVHEDSVYGLAWCEADEFAFCSLAYDGTAVVNDVPRATKYAALQA